MTGNTRKPFVPVISTLVGKFFQVYKESVECMTMWTVFPLSFCFKMAEWIKNKIVVKPFGTILNMDIPIMSLKLCKNFRFEKAINYSPCLSTVLTYFCFLLFILTFSYFTYYMWRNCFVHSFKCPIEPLYVKYNTKLFCSVAAKLVSKWVKNFVLNKYIFFRTVMGWIIFLPPNSYVEVLTPPPQNVSLFANRIFIAVIKLNYQYSGF